MSQPPLDDDPLAQLAEWGRTVERRARRGLRRRALARAALRSVGRLFSRPGRTVALLLIVAMVAFTGVGLSHWRAAGPSAYPSAVASGASVTASGHFTGTPAEDFPVGEAGLSMPAASAAGAWTMAEVEDALKRVRQALIASHLDPALQVDHDPSAFLRLVSTDTAAYVRTQLQRGGLGVNLVRFDLSSGVRPSAEKARVSGHTTYRATRWGKIDALEVVTNYVWVCAFDVPENWTGRDIVLVHDEEHWMFPKAASVAVAYQGMGLSDSGGYWDLMDCAATRRGLTAPFGTDAEVNPRGTAQEPESAYFRADHGLDVEDGCLDPSPTGQAK
ncbi:hypothetical protein [Hamadaea tsunoensis]|uniref:hypothetical protein n=1 Tax=Hamadaea tsunoensis TaxID=53368 RepID=UPI00040519DB|nr:hypothetical protein [Hamadaea tsunoensis]